jgi:hypothetical protein
MTTPVTLFNRKVVAPMAPPLANVLVDIVVCGHGFGSLWIFIPKTQT